MLMEMCMKVNGQTIRPTEKEPTFTLTVRCIQVIGKKMNNTAMGRRAGPTVLSMKVTMTREESTVEGSWFSQKAAITMVNSKRTKYAVKANITGQTERTMTESGSRIR
jgi:hypothetical protein